MARKPASTLRNSKVPKHIGKINMAPEKYYELKIHIKSIVLPGTPPFEGGRFDKETRQTYHQWLSNAVEEIGPRFFPAGGSGSVWPEDYNAIYEAVHQTVRLLTLGIRKNFKKKEMRAARKEESDNKMEMAQDNDGRYEGANKMGMAQNNDYYYQGDDKMEMAQNNDYYYQGDDKMEMAQDNDGCYEGANKMGMAQDNDGYYNGGNKMEMAQDNDDNSEGGNADDIGIKEYMILDEDEKYAQWGEEEEKMLAVMMAVDQENQEGDVIKEGMDAEPIELEDLLGLMKPEVFAHFPNLDDEYFDWDEITDPISPEPIARLLLLLP